MTGKVALVTGGSRGLGAEMARALAEHGAGVVVASRKIDDCERTTAAIAEATGSPTWAEAAHVGGWRECDALLDRVLDRCGRIDVLVNNAGIAPMFGRPHEATEAVYDKTMAVNLKGPFRLATRAAAIMEAADGGSIVNISAVAARSPLPREIIYGMAKAGLHVVTQCVAVGYGPTVRANTIMAGPFLTDMSKHWDLDAFAQYAQRMPARRGGDPSEIAGAAVFLAGPWSSYVTGAFLAVDGGMTLVRE